MFEDKIFMVSNQIGRETYTNLVSSVLLFYGRPKFECCNGTGTSKIGNNVALNSKLDFQQWKLY